MGVRDALGVGVRVPPVAVVVAVSTHGEGERVEVAVDTLAVTTGIGAIVSEGSAAAAVGGSTLGGVVGVGGGVGLTALAAWSATRTDAGLTSSS